MTDLKVEPGSDADTAVMFLNQLEETLEFVLLGHDGAVVDDQMADRLKEAVALCATVLQTEKLMNDRLAAFVYDIFIGGGCRQEPFITDRSLELLKEWQVMRRTRKTT
jgi:hypothetical protein